jgi:hypothetical protein
MMKFISIASFAAMLWIMVTGSANACFAPRLETLNNFQLANDVLVGNLISTPQMVSGKYYKAEVAVENVLKGNGALLNTHVKFFFSRSTNRKLKNVNVSTKIIVGLKPVEAKTGRPQGLWSVAGPCDSMGVTLATPENLANAAKGINGKHFPELWTVPILRPKDYYLLNNAGQFTFTGDLRNVIRTKFTDNLDIIYRYAGAEGRAGHITKEELENLDLNFEDVVSKSRIIVQTDIFDLGGHFVVFAEDGDATSLLFNESFWQRGEFRKLSGDLLVYLIDHRKMIVSATGELTGKTKALYEQKKRLEGFSAILAWPLVRHNGQWSELRE